MNAHATSAHAALRIKNVCALPLAGLTDQQIAHIKEALVFDMDHIAALEKVNICSLEQGVTCDDSQNRTSSSSAHDIRQWLQSENVQVTVSCDDDIDDDAGPNPPPPPTLSSTSSRAPGARAAAHSGKPQPVNLPNRDPKKNLVLYHHGPTYLCVPVAYGLHALREVIRLPFRSSTSCPPQPTSSTTTRDERGGATTTIQPTDERSWGKDISMRTQGAGCCTIRFTKPPMVDQESIFQQCWASLEETGFARPQMPCGSGKTVLAMALAARAGRKTAVVVLKKFFVPQWKREFNNKVPGVSVACLQGSKIDGNIETADVVIFLLQSLVCCKEEKAVPWASFGTVIFDECHQVGSRVFSTLVPKLACRYVIALSATPERKNPILDVLFGPVTLSIQRPFTRVEVWTMSVPPNGRTEKTMWNAMQRKREPNRMRMIADLTEDDMYNSRVTEDLMAELTGAAPGLTAPPFIIVLAETLAHLREIHRRVLLAYDSMVGVGSLWAETTPLLPSEATASTSITLPPKFVSVSCPAIGWAVGGQTLDSYKDKQLIFATCAYASEGLDVPRLDRIFLITPRADIRQAVGRILRVHVDKNIPRIYDYFHSEVCSMFDAMHWAHLHYYRQQKYHIHARPWSPPAHGVVSTATTTAAATCMGTKAAKKTTMVMTSDPHKKKRKAPSQSNDGRTSEPTKKPRVSKKRKSPPPTGDYSLIEPSREVKKSRVSKKTDDNDNNNNNSTSQKNRGAQMLTDTTHP